MGANVDLIQVQLSPLNPPRWVQLISSSLGPYVSSGPSDQNTGTVAINAAVGATYTLRTGPSRNGPWTTEDSAYVVSEPPVGSIANSSFFASNPALGPKYVLVGPASGVDDTALINNALATAGGATIVLTDEVTPYVCPGALAPPFTGPAGAPVQAPLRITSVAGTGAWSGYWAANPLNGGPVLDLRYAGGDGTHVAKFDTRGAGKLEIDHITIKSGGSDNYQIMQTTNTTVLIHDNAILGNAANSGTTCAQDFLLCGGNTTVIGNASNAPFQGYGSKLHDNFYSKIRRAVTWGTYCNGIEVENETISITCGDASATGAPYVFAPLATVACQGNRIRGGTIEVQNYKYAVAMLNDASANVFDAIGTYDDSGYTAGVIYCASLTTTIYNLVIAGFVSFTLQPNYLAGPGSGVNTLISSLRDALCFFPQGINSHVLVIKNSTGTYQIVKFLNLPASGQFNYLTGANYNQSQLYEITPSTAADAATFGTNGFRVDSGGHMLIQGTTPGVGTSLAANVTSITPAGTDQSGILTIVIGVGGTAAATVLGTIPFAKAYVVAPSAIPLVDQTTGNVTTFKFTSQTIGTTTFQIKAEQALAAGTYKVAYFCL